MLGFHYSSKGNSRGSTWGPLTQTLLVLLTYPISAPPQVREQMAPGSLLSSRTLAMILGRKQRSPGEQCHFLGVSGKLAINSNHRTSLFSTSFPKPQTPSLGFLLTQSRQGFQTLTSRILRKKKNMEKKVSKRHKALGRQFKGLLSLNIFCQGNFFEGLSLQIH